MLSLPFSLDPDVRAGEAEAEDQRLAGGVLEHHGPGSSEQRRKQNQLWKDREQVDRELHKAHYVLGKRKKGLRKGRGRCASVLRNFFLRTEEQK